MNQLFTTEMARLHQQELLRAAEMERLAMEAMEATEARPSMLERVLDGFARALRRRERKQAGGVVPQGTLGAIRPPFSSYDSALLDVAAQNTVPLLRP